jgi:hypothetical protein
MVTAARAVVWVVALAELALLASMERRAVPGPMERQPPMVVAAAVAVVPAVARAAPVVMGALVRLAVRVAALAQRAPSGLSPSAPLALAAVVAVVVEPMEWWPRPCLEEMRPVGRAEQAARAVPLLAPPEAAAEVAQVALVQS